MLDVTMVGCGTVGRGVMDILSDEVGVSVTQIVEKRGKIDALRREFLDLTVVSSLEDLPMRPAVVLECASSGAVSEHVLPALRSGIDCVLCTISALAEPGLPEALALAARKNNAHLQLMAGAIGGADAIAAANVGGLDQVVHSATKHPRSWKGTPAEEKLDLDHLEKAAIFFEGNAREAAGLYPDCANVAALVALLGIGLERTKVRLVADPEAKRNTHQVLAQGTFGEMTLEFAGLPLPGNSKTSALTVYSAVSCLRNRVSPLTI